MSKSPPRHLSTAAKKAWREVAAPLADEQCTGPASAALEAFSVQVARLRDAQARLDAEGLIVADEKGRPVKHPAVDLELAASTELRLWVARRPDLFGPSKVEPAKGDAVDQAAHEQPGGQSAAADPDHPGDSNIRPFGRRRPQAG